MIKLTHFLKRKLKVKALLFIVFKETNKGPQMQWVKVGKTDLNYVELKEGLNKSDIVYVLPSEGLIKSQQRFSERLRNRFS